MRNPRILLIAIGGVAAALVLVFGWLVWSGLSERADLAEQLEGAENQASHLLQLPVCPCQAAVDKVNSNETLYANWREETLAAISRGDRAFDPVTPPAFKTYLVNEARRLSSLPGAAGGRIVKADFPFGFKDYITGGVLPAKDDLPRLQREWSDVVTVVELLATNRVAEILDVRMVAAAAAAPAEDAKAKKKARGRRKTEVEELEKDITRFDIEFLARPEALAAVVNAFAANPRYIVVESLKFAREKDALVEELGGEEKKSAAAAAPQSRRARRRAALEESQKKSEGVEKKTGVVTDPATAAPLKVSVRLAVYDFRSAGAKGAADAKDGEKKEASK